MKRKIFLSVLLLVFLTLSPSGLALDPQKKFTQYVFDNWGLEDGLPQISIHAVIQTGDGYLWLGTQEGVARFDGVRFEVYNKNKVEQIKNNWINVLFEDRQNVLWIGTRGGGVTCLHPGEGKFTTITKEQGLAHNKVWSISEDHEGGLWIGTEGGMNLLKNGKILTYTTKDGLSNDLVMAIHEDRNGNLWIGTDGGGLNRRKDDRFITYTTKEGLANERVMAIYEDSTGNLWIGTDNGLNCLEPGSEKFITYTTGEGLSSNRIRTIYEDGDRNLWIGTYDGGLNRLEQGKFTICTAKEGLANDSIWCIYEDGEGSLWIGTYKSGLYRLQDGKFTTYSHLEGLADDMVKSVCEGPDGSIWIGTDGGGLNRLKQGKFTAYTTGEGLSDNRVKCLYCDKEGNLWIGTGKGGLNRFKDGEFTIYTTKQGLANDLVRSLCEDRDRGLWIGTGAGLNRFKDGKFTLYTTKQGLTSDIIRCIYEDREGSLWIGTDGGGLNRLKDGKFTTFTSREGLANDSVWCIVEDREGNLWIGTNGGGLSRLENGKFINITTNEGLFDDTIHQILEDDNGNLWMSCNKGIFQVSSKDINDFIEDKSKTLHCVSYNERDGMKSRECNGGTFPNGCKSRDGKLWFPTIKGVVTIDPNNLKTNMPPPPVRIEEIIVDGREIKSPLFTTSEPLVLSPGKNQVEIHYTCLSFLDAEKGRFKCKLEGFDKEWQDVGPRRTAYYSKIPPGDYTFRVNACRRDGIWNETGASVSFSLEPHFYQAFWFRGLCGLVIVLMGFAGYRLRVRFLKKRTEELTGELRAQVEERTRDLEKRQKDLEERNEELEAIDESIKAINREFKLEKVFKSILQQAMKLCPLAEKGTFLIYDNKEKQFRVAANLGAHSTSEKNITLTYKEAIRRYTERTDQMKNGVYVLQQFKGAAGEEKLKSLPVPQATLAMSVILEEKPQGFLILDSMGYPNAFDHSAIQRLVYLREHAVLAMSKAGALEQLKQEKEKVDHALKTAERAKKMAEKANKAKTIFLADRSHDIRNHMNLILGFSQVLKTEIIDEQQKRNLEAILSSGRTLLKLIDDLLDLSRIESGKMEPEYEALNIRSILDEIKNIFSKKAREKALDFQLDVDPALPEVVIMDGLWLRRILENLVSNAVNYTDKGFIRLSAQTIGSQGDRVNMAFSVQDSGKGIPKNQQKCIFDPFKRQKGYFNGQYEGAGLGLTITRRLVQLMGGEISLDSQVGKGSTFRVTLENISVSGVVIESEIPEPDVEGIRFEEASLLVVDDVEQSRRLLKEYLSQSPFQFIEAENGTEAVKLAKEHHPDLVLMDMRMPKMNGGEATRLIKADKKLRNIPVIIITGSAMELQRQEIKEAGGDGYLTKPVSKSDLIIELTRFLKWSHAEITGPGKPPGIEKEKGIMTPLADFLPQKREKLQELLTYLEGEDLDQRLELLIKRFIIDDIENFSKEMKTLAEKYEVVTLYQWTDKLFNDIKTFNRAKIEKTLASLPGLIEEIKEKYYDG
jgi:ligand-binding sensor domain-containing protein/signal transduction histidine kinase/ActR/RegA family two-component response regulator